MTHRSVTPDNTVFIVISFEGPDSYSLAGGLGVRVDKMTQALAQEGYETHHIFIGDPFKSGISTSCSGRLIQHRWCQWISQYHPHGVYDGEEGKLNDFNQSLPEYLVEAIARPHIEMNKRLVILAEEWHTAEAICQVSELLTERGLKEGNLLLWNANNTYSFSRINWSKLNRNVVITTVSRYMRQLMLPYGVEPLVIPNGIHPDLFQPVETCCCDILRDQFRADIVLFKMARFDPAKGWIKAVETAACLKRLGYSVRFVVRGGKESYGWHVLQRARSLGLAVQDVEINGNTPEGSIHRIIAAKDAHVVNIKSFIPHELSRILFACSDAVLADSAHEPFGLVGLEAMASGGLAFVGNTGEDYARDSENAMVLETSKPSEAAASVLYLHQRRELSQQIRENARSKAREYIWNKIIKGTLQAKLQRLAWERLVA